MRPSHPGVAWNRRRQRAPTVDERKLDYFAGLARDRYVASNTASNRPSTPRSRAVNRGYRLRVRPPRRRDDRREGPATSAHFILGLPGETGRELLDQVEPDQRPCRSRP